MEYGQLQVYEGLMGDIEDWPDVRCIAHRPVAVVYTRRGDEVQIVADCVWSLDHARLFAAAPEMYKLCILALATIDDYSPGLALIEKRLLRRLRDVIAAVKGEGDGS